VEIFLLDFSFTTTRKKIEYSREILDDKQEFNMEVSNHKVKFSETIRDNPQRTETYSRLAKFDLDQGQLLQAAHLWEELANLRPEYASTPRSSCPKNYL